MICELQHGRRLCPVGTDAVLRRGICSRRSPRSLSSYLLSSVRAEVVAAQRAVVVVVEVPMGDVGVAVVVGVWRGETLRG